MRGLEPEGNKGDGVKQESLEVYGIPHCPFDSCDSFIEASLAQTGHPCPSYAHRCYLELPASFCGLVTW